MELFHIHLGTISKKTMRWAQCSGHVVPAHLTCFFIQESYRNNDHFKMYEMEKKLKIKKKNSDCKKIIDIIELKKKIILLFIKVFCIIMFCSREFFLLNF